ncbi:hypothetical protein [Faecalimicrobium dakarense]|uniref:hypothetical protein n=1 Tax=Faecalimicrobium dakarense TaxID=1301100 RepID=UPI0004BB257A|nr:hypothetical protein [[Clostridium] dakarense]
MNSITKFENLNDPYIVVGNRMYSIANQDGEFPRLGWHVEGEMAGVWAHPIKLFNEYGICVYKENEKINIKAKSFNIEPTKANTKFLGDKIEITKSEFVPDDLEALVIDYSIKAICDFNYKIEFKAVANVIGTWTAEDAGFKNGTDEVFENNNKNKVVFKDSINPWFAGIYAKDDASVDISEDELLSAKFSYNLELKKDEVKTLRFIIVGSSVSYEQFETTLNNITNNLESLIEAKENRYEEIRKKI